MLRGFVEDDPRERIELTDPGLALEHRLGVGVTRVPALPDAGGTEIDVLCVIFVRQLRCQ